MKDIEDKYYEVEEDLRRRGETNLADCLAKQRMIITQNRLAFESNQEQYKKRQAV